MFPASLRTGIAMETNGFFFSPHLHLLTMKAIFMYWTIAGRDSRNLAASISGVGARISCNFPQEAQPTRRYKELISSKGSENACRNLAQTDRSAMTQVHHTAHGQVRDYPNSPSLIIQMMVFAQLSAGSHLERPAFLNRRQHLPQEHEGTWQSSTEKRMNLQMSRSLPGGNTLIHILAQQRFGLNVRILCMQKPSITVPKVMTFAQALSRHL